VGKMAEEEENADGLKNKPSDDAFKQQRLHAWQPILTPCFVITTFALTGIVFLVIGIAILVASGDVVEVTSGEYQDMVPVPNDASSCVQGELSTSTSCVVETSLEIDSDMNSPVYMYYRLHSFYQNHRRYAKSRNDGQLRGDSADHLTTTTGCKPKAERPCPTGRLGDQGTCVTYPCGLIASSVFNDTFYASPPVTNPSVDTVYKRNNCGSNITNIISYQSNPLCKKITDCVQVQRANQRGTCNFEYIPWTSQGIAWSSDVDEKFITIAPDDEAQFMLALPYDNFKYFKCTDTAFTNANGNLHNCPVVNRYADVGNEEFIVWMRTSGLPTFDKLHRIINSDLKQGDVLYFYVNNIFPVSGFGGTKKVRLSTTEWVGGKASFLGWGYIVVSILCVLLAILFACKQAFDPRSEEESASDIDEAKKEGNSPPSDVATTGNI